MPRSLVGRVHTRSLRLPLAGANGCRVRRTRAQDPRLCTAHWIIRTAPIRKRFYGVSNQIESRRKHDADHRAVLTLRDPCTGDMDGTVLLKRLGLIFPKLPHHTNERAPM